jgi:methylenetetrahydrofolate--tRNA-(uracil-5-)-methyltransferase
VHRNTYIESPKVLNDELALKAKPNVWLAGQVTGVEGYTESAAIGLIVGRVVAGKVNGKPFVLPPKQSMIGALVDYVRSGVNGPYQPMNTNLGLLEPAPYSKKVGKAERKKQTALIARKAFDDYFLSLSDTAVRTIDKKSAATSDAPPISAPSTFG